MPAEVLCEVQGNAPLAAVDKIARGYGLQRLSHHRIGFADSTLYRYRIVSGRSVEATVQRARPVLLTALAAVLAFIPLTTSVFWGSMACTLIGGTAAGTVLTLVFLPALYAIWFRVRRPAKQPIGDLSLATAQ